MHRTTEPRPFKAKPRSHEWGISVVIRWFKADLVTHILPT
ncbi:hypothetical protein SynBIOSE41_02131 [Synechococcus sp. BIOS-E4-1]|nr:hypothetical protein SynBIOSE41_02131 [Synechococcus sp. BIOS-E4-1]